MIRVCSRSLVVVACIFGFSTAAHALPIVDLFNTGVGVSGVLLPGGDGVTDPHYVVSGPGTGGPVSAQTYKHPSYFADGPISRWISSSANGFPGNGTFVFQTSFTLAPLFNPAATSISVLCATDNLLSGVTLNGSAVTGDCDGFAAFAPAFNITSGFVAGVNTLAFSVVDLGPPMAFRAEYISNTALLPTDQVPVPEPTTMLLFGTGMVAMRLIRGRRSSSRRSA